MLSYHVEYEALPRFIDLGLGLLLTIRLWTRTGVQQRVRTRRKRPASAQVSARFRVETDKNA
jgi:hypothetical protein